MKLSSLILAAAIATAPATALACNSPVITIDADGQATWTSPKNDARAQMEDLIGPAPTKDAIAVFDARTRSGQWADLKSVSPSEIRVLAGIDSPGFLYAGPDECTPRNADIILPENGGRVPVDLFPDEPSIGLQPRPGLWQANLGETQMEGCPAVLQGVFPVAGKLPAEMLEPRRLDFTPPFHPKQLPNADQIRGTWTATGEQKWQMNFDTVPGMDTQMPGGTKVTWDLTVISPSEMQHLSTVHVKLPDEMIAVLGSGKRDCRVYTTSAWVRLSD
ncbi:hypothetical protein [Devosia limi]|nr:hypothetical protein [Devosia limi]